MPSVLADTYGAIIGLLADLPDDTTLPDVDPPGQVMSRPRAPATLDAFVRAGSVRQAARLAGVHHSRPRTRLDTITETVGFDPLDGIVRNRLGLAYLVWRLRNSRVLDLPAPSYRTSPDELTRKARGVVPGGYPVPAPGARVVSERGRIVPLCDLGGAPAGGWVCR
jgi:hypothetical protein